MNSKIKDFFQKGIYDLPDHWQKVDWDYFDFGKIVSFDFYFDSFQPNKKPT